MEQSLTDKIKKFYFNHQGRFSRETFAIALACHLLFLTLSTPFLYSLCSLFLPALIVNMMSVAYVLCVLYALFVISIKRLHDLNLVGWYSLALMFPIINFLLILFLLFQKGKPANNKYGVSIPYKGPSFFVFVSYAIAISLFAIGAYYYWQFRDVSSLIDKGGDPQEVTSALIKTLPKNMQGFSDSMGAVFVDNQLVAPIATITETRVLVQGLHFKRKIQSALSDNKQVEVRMLNKKTALITKMLGANDKPTVQMSVFEMDQAIGVPGHLNEKNRKILEELKAFD